MNLKRKVRWYNKRFGLFGWSFLKDIMPVSEEEYHSVLSKLKKLKKRKGKSPLVRYGRYRQMEKYLTEYKQTGDLNFLIRANEVRNRLSKMYKLEMLYQGKKIVYSYSAIIDYKQILKIIELSKHVKSHEEYEAMVKKELQYTSY